MCIGYKESVCLQMLPVSRNMARVPCPPCIILLIPWLLQSTLGAPQEPLLTSVSVTNVNSSDAVTRTLFVGAVGHNLHAGLQIRTSGVRAPVGTLCKDDLNASISEVRVWGPHNATFALHLPSNRSGHFYFCLPVNNTEYKPQIPPVPAEPVKWYHQGEEVFVTVTKEEAGLSGRTRREKVREGELAVLGLRLEKAHKDVEVDDDGVPDLLANTENILRLFGVGFTENMTVTFTSETGKYGGDCLYPETRGFSVESASFSPETVRVKVKLPPFKTDETEYYYVCVQDGKNGTAKPFFIHQGDEMWLRVISHENSLPVWVTICIIVTCLMFSFLFSGLNLGLMSLDRTELKILCNTGRPNERKYAKVIQPVRDHGNYLLCSILLGNVFVNSIFTILLDGLTSGMIAVVFSTIAIVIFGEITPQAICSRHGLWVGAKTIYITRLVMILTFPLSYPVSKFLDYLLGVEIGNVYNRERLKELIKVSGGETDLDKDEVNIISGALELRKKTVADVMTKIEDVFMLDYDAVLDFDTISEIMKSGYSRVPVYEGNRLNIVTMLYIKDLAFVDPDDNTPLKTLCQFYQNPCNFVFEDVTLDVMFKIFKEGNKGHMAFVHRVNNEGPGDPFYETIGLITLEDVIEELIQAEIMDETDVFTDNRTKRRRNNAERTKDFSVFAERRGEGNRIRISPQLTLAAYQFLSTTVELFLPAVISETILKRLLRQDIIHHIKKSKEWRTDPTCLIYQQGKSVDYFVLILEGRVEVTVGKENLIFEGGPFTYFGTQALIQSIGIAESPSIPASTIGSLESLNLDARVRHTFLPDYTVRAITEVIYLRIKNSLYLAAKRATLMERSTKGDPNHEQFDAEVDKLLHSLDEDEVEMTQLQMNRTPTRKRSGVTINQTSPNKNPSLYSNASPPHRVSQRDLNGSTLMSSNVDDSKDEEMALLSKKS